MAQIAWRLLGATVLVVNGWAVAQAADMTPEQRKNEIRNLGWVKGPSDAAIGDKARVKVPNGMMFLTEKDGSRFLELTGNLPSPGHSILVSENWWATFAFADVGYIKDDEKLDPDALLKQIKSRDEPANEERRKRGMAELHTDGWLVPPHYDPETKYLEWGLKLHEQGSPEPVVNYTVRLLGRTGYESVTLVSSPATMEQDVAGLKQTLKSFDFNSGEKYSEFKSGDRIAQFGLGALIVGGAAAAAVKTGLWKTIAVALAAGWKLVVAAVVAGFAAIGKIFKRNKG